MSAYLYLFFGLVVLIISGDLLVKGSVQLAHRFKISTFIVGLTVVAYGTSTPEIFIGIKAALDGSHDIAIGNVIGSNIANIGLILAIVVLVCPILVRNRAVGFDLAIMFFVTILLFVFGYNGIISRLEGIFLLIVLISYTVWAVFKSRKTTIPKETEKATMKPFLASLMILVSIVGLYFSSDWFVHGAKEIATKWGVSERVIAISIVAIGTSMPELVTAMIAAFKKEADLAIGNIIGSNFFNIVGVLGITATVRPLTVSNHTLFVSDMMWLFGISIALVLTMIPLSKGKITRWEGALLLLMFVIYMVILFR